jgi:hypothetical protein
MNTTLLRCVPRVAASAILTAAFLGGTAVAHASSASVSAGPKSCVLNVEDGAYACYAGRSKATNQVNAAGQVVLGVFYDEYDYQGNVLYLTGSHYCYSDGNMDFQRMLPREWRDRILSLQPRNSCWVYLFTGPLFDGTRSNAIQEDRPWLGSWDQIAESVAFS